MMIGVMAGAVAGGPHPATSPGGAFAVTHAALPDPAADAAGDDAALGLQAATARRTQERVAASVKEQGLVLGAMATSYPWSGNDGAARTARIRERHPEDR
jgi:hypothetical protein